METPHEVPATALSENVTTQTPPMRPLTTTLLTGAFGFIIAVGVVSVFLSRVNFSLSLGILLLCLGITVTLHQLTKKRFPQTPVAPPWPLQHDVTALGPDTVPPSWPHSF